MIMSFQISDWFLDECSRVLSTKLAIAKQSSDEIKTKLNKLATELGKLENTRKEVEKESYELLFFFIRSFLFWFYMLI